MVAYREGILVRIPVDATNLSHEPPTIHITKISITAITELSEIARHLGLLSQTGDQI
jgi:prophage tail gpP-like protein